MTDILHRKDNKEDKRYFSAYHALEKMDVPTLLFFLGILLAVGSLRAAGQLGQMAVFQIMRLELIQKMVFILLV